MIMLLSTQALQTAAGALQQISDTTPGERGRRASLVALVLRSVEVVMEGEAAGEFLVRRAAGEVSQLPGGAERRTLWRLLRLADDGGEGLADLLNDYAAALEEARRLPEADAVVGLARAHAPERADLALRAARLARLEGRGEEALELYGSARELDGGDGAIARLAAIGAAVVAADPVRALTWAIRRAIRAGDNEAAAVGLEERARVRRGNGDRQRAARDLGFAAARFTDPVDRGRVAHQLADLFVAGGDPYAAREALLFALGSGDRSQQAHARARLHTVSRDVGDQIGMRRWRSFSPPPLVSLSLRPSTPVGRSAAPEIARWRERVERSLRQPWCPSDSGA